MINPGASWASLTAMFNVGKCLIFILLIGGCVKKDLPPPQQVGPMPSSSQNLTLELRLDKPSYKRTESVRMTLTVTNRSKVPFRETFRSAQTYDFIVKKDGEEIWRWSHDRMFAQVLLDIKIEPGKALSYREVWDQRDNAGNVVPRGRYEVVGVLKTTPETVSLPVMIELVE